MSEWESDLFFDESRSSGVEDNDCSSFSENVDATCFLCLNNISYQSSLNSDEDPLIKIEAPDSPFIPKKFSLLRICRYLKLNSEPIFAQCARENQTNDLSVNLCQQCLTICSKLSDLCSQMELLQMKIIHNLKSFSGILDNSKDEHFQTSGESMEAGDVNSLKHFREQLKKNCYRKLKSDFPKVLLKREIDVDTSIPIKCVATFSERIDVDDHDTSENSPYDGGDNSSEDDNLPGPKSSKSISSSHMCWKCPDCPAKYYHKRNLYSHQRKKHNVQPNFLGFLCVSCNTNFPQKTEFLNHKTLPTCPLSLNRIRKLGRNNATYEKTVPWKCNHCNPPRIIQDPGGFRRHNVNKHVETFFESSKLSNISMDNFELYCEHVVKIEILSSTKIPSADNSGQSSRCPHCQSNFLDDVNLRYHLVLSHKEILGGKILALQKNCNVDEIKRWRSITQKEFKLKCNACQMTFTHKQSLVRHHRSGLCKATRNNGDVKSGRKIKICKLCTPHVPLTYNNYQRHQAQLHSESFFISSKLSEVNQTDFKIYCDHVIKVELLSCQNIHAKSTPMIKCSHCPARYVTQTSLYIHLLSTHQPILAEKIVKLQESTKVEEIRNVALPGYSRLLKKRWTCKICGKTLANQFGLRRHTAQMHGRARKGNNGMESGSLNVPVTKVEVDDDDDDQTEQGFDDAME